MYDELLGRRVTVRRVVGRAGDVDGGRPLFADVVGVLVSAGEELRIRRRDGGAVGVPAAAVHRVKAVPFAAADVLGLERTAALGWPAPDREWLGGWLLRAAGGFTNRANSVLPLGSPEMPVAQAVEAVNDWYAARGLPARFQLPLPGTGSLDDRLAAAGWPADTETLVRTADLGVVAARAGECDGVQLAVEPDERWLALYHYRGGGAVPPIGRAIMVAAACPVFASVCAAGETIAVARAVVDDGWLGVTAVEVAPPHRRRGLARRMMAALTRWGAGHGAVTSYLQVPEGNAAANALYDRLGYTTHHRYHYRAGPPG